MINSDIVMNIDIYPLKKFPDDDVAKHLSHTVEFIAPLFLSIKIKSNVWVDVVHVSQGSLYIREFSSLAWKGKTIYIHELKVLIMVIEGELFIAQKWLDENYPISQRGSIKELDISS